jgi:Na+/proline symporter
MQGSDLMKKFFSKSGSGKRSSVVRRIILIFVLVVLILLIAYILRACYWGIVYNTFPWE